MHLRDQRASWMYVEVVLQNRFHVLSDTEDTEDEQNLESASSIGQVVKRVRRRWEINHLGRDKKKEVQLGSVFDDQFLELTVDSSAGEDVMNEKMAPRTPLRYSDEQDAGVLYTTANGKTMPNREKKVLHVVTKEGHTRAMNMHSLT